MRRIDGSLTNVRLLKSLARAVLAAPLKVKRSHGCARVPGTDRLGFELISARGRNAHRIDVGICGVTERSLIRARE